MLATIGKILSSIYDRLYAWYGMMQHLQSLVILVSFCIPFYLILPLLAPWLDQISLLIINVVSRQDKINKAQSEEQIRNKSIYHLRRKNYNHWKKGKTYIGRKLWFSKTRQSLPDHFNQTITHSMHNGTSYNYTHPRKTTNRKWWIGLAIVSGKNTPRSIKM